MLKNVKLLTAVVLAALVLAALVTAPAMAQVPPPQALSGDVVMFRCVRVEINGKIDRVVSPSSSTNAPTISENDDCAQTIANLITAGFALSVHVTHSQETQFFVFIR